MKKHRLDLKVAEKYLKNNNSIAKTGAALDSAVDLSPPTPKPP
jgi:hypothetical protein